MFEVYCLTSPSGKKYVGFTSKTSDRRWYFHVNAAKNGSKLPLHNAIRKYGPEAFTRSLLERMTTETGAKRAEQLWIKELGTACADLGYNATLGGDGGVPSEATRARMAAAQRGKKASPETRAKMSAARRGKKQPPEVGAKISASKLGKPRSPETRAKLAKAQRGKKASPETRAKMSAAHRNMPDTWHAEMRAKISAAHLGKIVSPETREKMSVAAQHRKPGHYTKAWETRRRAQTKT